MTKSYQNRNMGVIFCNSAAMLVQGGKFIKQCHIVGFVQDYSISSALLMEVPQSYTKQVT